MNRSLLSTILLASLALVPAGCASLASLSAPSLNDRTDATSVVVVEPDITVYAPIFGIHSSASPVSGLLARVDGTHGTIEGTMVSNYLVFPNVPPGKWQLVKIEADSKSGNMTWRKEYGVPLQSVDAFTFDVKAGEPIYARAKIEDDARSDTKGVRFARNDDAGAERKAWEWMGEVYEKTAWAPVFRSKAGGAETKAQPASAPKNGG